LCSGLLGDCRIETVAGRRYGAGMADQEIKVGGNRNPKGGFAILAHSIDSYGLR
jgi:hypothetical protein